MEVVKEGKHRAAYGKKVLEVLSDRLIGKFSPMWSADTLKRCMYFFSVYSY